MLPTSLICICISHREQLHKFIKKVSAGMREILFWSRWFPEFAKAIKYVSSAVSVSCICNCLSVFMAFSCIVFLSSFWTLPELCNQMLSSQKEILDCVTHKKFSHDVRKIVWPSGKQASARDLWFSTYKLRNFQHVRINSSLFFFLYAFHFLSLLHSAMLSLFRVSQSLCFFLICFFIYFMQIFTASAHNFHATAKYVGATSRRVASRVSISASNGGTEGGKAGHRSTLHCDAGEHNKCAYSIFNLRPRIVCQSQVDFAFALRFILGLFAIGFLPIEAVFCTCQLTLW